MDDRFAMVRSCASAAILTDVAVERGMTVEQCLTGTGIAAGALTDPLAEITMRQELRLVANVLAAIGHVPALGLTAGQRYHAATHGVWGLALIASTSVRRAIYTAVDYIDLAFSCARWRVEEDDTAIGFVIDDSPIPPLLRGFLIERDVAAVVTVQRDVYGTAPIRSIELAIPAPSYAGRFADVLGVAPAFNTASTRIAINAEVLEHPLPQANPLTAALCEQQCAAMLQQRRERLGIGGQVREALLAHGLDATPSDIADALRMSERTLRRRLREDGTTFQELTNEIKQMFAEQYLRSGTTVETVAARLGFSDASSFTRSFQRWTGTTPGRYAKHPHTAAGARRQGSTP